MPSGKVADGKEKVRRNPLKEAKKYLKKEYGRDLVFFGGIDVQELLPYQNPAVVKKEITRRCKILGQGGGYIAAPAHNIQPDTPVENVLAMYEAIFECSN